MSRAPFNVVVFPYKRNEDGSLRFALLKRRDDGAWQGVSGGGEDDESPLSAAKREVLEELGVQVKSLVALDATEPIPAPVYRDSVLWGDDVYVIPQLGFGLQMDESALTLSAEHVEYRWLTFEEAYSLLRHNHTPFWELNARLLGHGPRGAPLP